MFTNTGTNDGVEGDLLAFKFESVTLGKDEDGEWTTAPVMYQVDEIPAKQEDGGGSADRAAILAAIRKLVDDKAEGVIGVMVPKGLIREQYNRTRPGQPASQKAQFNRAFKQLKDAGAISVGNGAENGLIKIEQEQAEH